jgi:predicted secreted hydrolase
MSSSNMKLKLIYSSISWFWMAILVSGCAGSRFHLPNIHSESIEEDMWQPTSNKKEWWYLTGQLEDTLGNIYFHQFTIFHGRKLGREGYVSHIAFADYTANQHDFTESYSFRRIIDKTSNSISVGNDTILRQSDGLYVHSSDSKHEVKLNLTKVKPLVGHGREGLIYMGAENKRKAQSAYFSYTNLTANGLLTKANGETTPVTGNFWFDRQYGNFSELYWQWYSLRMFNDEEIMIFHFPNSDYTIADKVLKDGTIQPLNNVIIEPTDSIWDNGIPFPTTSKILINGNEELEIRPLLSNQVNANKIGPIYWEGLCGVYNKDGVQVGWAVVELTSAKSL